MKALSLRQLAIAAGGQLAGPEDLNVTGFATDSREVKKGDLFIAIKGERVDGHSFVQSVLESGAAAALVERPVEGPHVLVDDVVQGLARLGRHFRAEFKGPVVGVTGSAGKTTTKELVAAALSPLGHVLKTEGNRNTEYTSPLVWSELEANTCAAVIEMGMRGFGQIAHLASVASPTVGLITNIGYAHLELVKTREGIAQAKGELLEALPSTGKAILWNECEFLELLVKRAGGRQVWKFGFDAGSECLITDYKTESWTSTVVSGTCFGHPWDLKLGVAGRHVALDAAAALLTAAALGVDLQEACDAIAEAKLPPMRMEVREMGGATVLLDAYNASPPSMISALETLAEVPASGRRLAVLGEMRELGDYAESGHRAVGAALGRLPLDQAVFVGEQMRFALEEAGREGFTLGTNEDAATLIRSLKPGDVVLIKGSRALELERILETAAV